ncbi:PREDICTED: sperm surface protein Sp17 isoform X1 [Hipposideros armiger]|uniref:Sperm surface protein Sp17 isoform X1 n=1 Tax=Hipposideros armiger TaxID=186990 RepID=A0A8B7SQR8_HIPAR|nr:PREDICTED: sperm surface protein Sp17 isoform X1 [Hipposideros armiger]
MCLLTGSLKSHYFTFLKIIHLLLRPSWFYFSWTYWVEGDLKRSSNLTLPFSSRLFLCTPETNFDPAEWGTKVDDCFYNNHAFKEHEPPEKGKSQTSMKEETKVTALESSEEDKEKEENAAVKIQAAFRGHLAREEVKKMKKVDLQEEKTQENN